MRPEHLDLLSAAGPPTLSPAGDRVVVAVTRPDLESDTYRGCLWVVPTGGGSPHRLTNGERDTSPAVSPDGRRVAFLRAVGESAPQIHVTGIDGGEPLRLTDHPLGAGAPSWSPDGRSIVHGARVPEPGRYGTEDADGKKVAPNAEPARLITELAYRVDDIGYTRDRRRHVFVLDVPPEDGHAGAELPKVPVAARQLTTGDHDDTDPAWSPDGDFVAFVSARHETRENDLRTAVHLVRADASEPDAQPMVVTGGDLSVGGFQWLPDGRLVVAAGDLGPHGLDFVGNPERLWVTREAVGSGTCPILLEQLASGHELELEGGSAGLVVTAGNVVVQALHRGAVRLLAVDVDDPGAEPAVVLDGQVVVTGHAATRDGSVLVAGISDPGRAGDLAVIRDGVPRWLSDLGGRLRAEGLVEPRELDAVGADGHPVHGWVLLPDPERFGAGPHPVLLSIHGGPFSLYDWGLLDEAQVYAGAGYAVLMCNPRGSASYGHDHGRSIRQAMGTVDADDVLGFLDHALTDERLPLDADRVGVMGGSYGGYLTALLTTCTDRFVAAIVERGYLDATSFVGSSDIGWFFPGQYHGDAAAMEAQSPMSAVDKVTTPTLVIHSEEDWRCPVEQGQRWFAALKLRGVHAELLLFPGEGHELSRSGRPRHRRQRFEHILRWWGQHLPVG